jgi:hypothetical protein
MSLKVVSLPDKQPSEKPAYAMDISPISVFGDGTEVISSVATVVYNDVDDPATFTDLTTMHTDATVFVGTVITTFVSGGTDGQSYILRHLITGVLGGIYEVEGRIHVKEIG